MSRSTPAVDFTVFKGNVSGTGELHGSAFDALRERAVAAIR
jgi:hypothetical protein